MESEELLPKLILSKASLAGKEYAWRKDDVVEAIIAAKQTGLATSGGSVQFRIPQGTCDLYWLFYNPEPRIPGELWGNFVTRSADECITLYSNLCKAKDIILEGKEGFRILKEIAGNEDISKYLWYVLYFDTEDEYNELFHYSNK